MRMLFWDFHLLFIRNQILFILIVWCNTVLHHTILLEQAVVILTFIKNDFTFVNFCTVPSL